MFREYANDEAFKTECGYELNGSWYPRVTKIVSIKAKPALYRYYAEAPSFAAAETAKDQSAKEGTEIHEAVEKLLLGQGVMPEPNIAPAIESFLQFLARKPIRVQAENVERRISHDIHRYAGTVDAIAWIDGKLGVLDIKTSKSIYRDYNLQTAAYMEALKDFFPELSTRWILRIDQSQICNRCGAKMRTKGGVEKVKKNGMFLCPPHLGHEWQEPRGEIEIKEFPSWQTDFEAFLGAKKLWEWENEYWLKRVNYL